MRRFVLFFLFWLIVMGFSSLAVEAKGSNVPFTVQAPSRQWDDPVFQNACEEASILMANAWLSGKTLPRKKVIEERIQDLSQRAEKLFGEGTLDTSADDTAKIFRAYSGTPDAITVIDAVTLPLLQSTIQNGNIVIVPVDGRVLANPYYTAPGPERHMLVVIGYDAKKKEFITNDPGTRRGKSWRYKEEKLFRAIRDYPTGHEVPITAYKKAMIIIER